CLSHGHAAVRRSAWAIHPVIRAGEGARRVRRVDLGGRSLLECDVSMGAHDDADCPGNNTNPPEVRSDGMFPAKELDSEEYVPGRPDSTFDRSRRRAVQISFASTSAPMVGIPSMNANSLEALVANMSLAELAQRSGRSVEELVNWALGGKAPAPAKAAPARPAPAAAAKEAKPARRVVESEAPARRSEGGASKEVNTRTPEGRKRYS